CLDTCLNAVCGDGHVRTGVEQCDDGNASNNDACLASCLHASCGDGFLWTGIEQCDGNQLGGATCVTQGYAGGNLACSQGCTFDTSGCIPGSCGTDATPPGGTCPAVC